MVHRPALADQFQMALLVIHHLRKRTGSGQASAMQPGAEDLRGSSHLSAAARSLLTLGLSAAPNGEPDLNGPRRLAVTKTNLCRYPPPIWLLFEQGTGSVPLLRWLDQPPEAELPSLEQRCVGWLLDFLTRAGQPVRPCDVVDAARLAGFPKRTLYRARSALADKVVNVGNSPHDPGNRWGLLPPPK